MRSITSPVASLSLLATLAACVAGCSDTLPPKQLVDARAAYQTASRGVAAQEAPAELHVAKQSLDQAESFFRDDGNTPGTADYAYVAFRRVQLAEAAARVRLLERGEGSTRDGVVRTGGNPRPQAAPVAAGRSPDVQHEEAPRADLSPAVTSPSQHSQEARVAYVSASPQRSAYALIVGIDRYRDIPAATGAKADAIGFTDVVRKTLGIPERHIVVATDEHATRLDIEKAVDQLKATVPNGSRIYFFFSGHGSPNPTNGTPYLVPYDGDPKDIGRTALPLANILKSLSESRAREVVAILDSCFSGVGGRSVLAPGMRPLVRVKEMREIEAPRVAVLAAAGASEISGPAPDSEGGLFSTHLIEALRTGRADADGDGQITLQELSEYLRPRVARDAKRANREQTPTLTVGGEVTADDIVVEWGLANR